MFNSEQLERMRTSMIKSDLILLLVGNHFVESIKDPENPEHVVDVTQFEIAKNKEHVAILWTDISSENEAYFREQLEPVKPFYENHVEAEPLISQLQEITKVYEKRIGATVELKVQTRGDFGITGEPWE